MSHGYGFKGLVLKLKCVSIPPKAFYICKAVLSKFQRPFFTEIKKPILKFIRCFKGPWTAKEILRKKKTAGSQKSPSNFKLYHGAKVTKTVWNCHKHRCAIKEKNTEQAQQKNSHADT